MLKPMSSSATALPCLASSTTVPGCGYMAISGGFPPWTRILICSSNWDDASIVALYWTLALMSSSTTFWSAFASSGSMALKTVTVPVAAGWLVPGVAVLSLLSLPHAARSVSATTGRISIRSFIHSSSLLAVVLVRLAGSGVDTGPVVGIEEMQARRVDDELDVIALLDARAGVQAGDDAG